jgi:hypothetical protein
MGVPVIDASTGATVDVAPEVAHQGFFEGRYRLPDGGVQVRLPDGRIGSVPSAEAQGVLESGGTLATTQEYEEYGARRRAQTPGQIAITAGEGLARGLSFGGYDVAARALGVDTEAMRLRQETNPWTAGITEGIGSIAPMFIPGVGEIGAARALGEAAVVAREASALGRAGEAALTAGRVLGAPTRAVGVAGDLAATGARIAGEALGLSGDTRLARMAVAGLEGTARGAAEGALMGAGQAVSESALSRNPDLTAEHLLAAMGTGALFGSFAGGALGVGGRALREGGELAASGAVRAAERAGVSRAALADARIVARLNASGLDEAAIAALGTKPTQIVADLERLGIGTREGLTGTTGLATARSSARDAATVVREADTTLTRLQGELDRLPEVAVSQRSKLGERILQAATDKQIAEVVAASVSRAPSREGLGAALKEGVDSALNLGFLGHMMGSPTSAVTTFAAGVGKKLVQNTAEAFVPALQSKAIDFLLRATEEGTANTARAAAGIIAKTATRAVQSAVPRAAAAAAEYNLSVEAARADTPELVVQRIATAMPELAHSAPRVLAAVTQKALTSRAFLESKIPVTDRHPVGDLQPQLRKKSPVSESEQRRFLAFKKAVDDPASIIESVANQTLTTEQAEVLKEVYPALHQKITEKVMEGLAAATEPMSFQSKMRLGILLGSPTDPTLDPSFINSMQASLQTAAPPEQPRQLDSRGLDRISNTVALNSSFSDSLSARQFRT